MPVRPDRIAATSFGLFCKSFRRDLVPFERLLASANEHARDPMPLAVSVPAEDLPLFAPIVRRHAGGRIDVQLTADEELLGISMPQTWHAQQVVKLEAWRLGFAETFLVVDSDFRFLRGFGASDFVLPDGRVPCILSCRAATYDDDFAGRSACTVDVAQLRDTAVSPPRWGTLSRTTRWLDQLLDRPYDRMIHRIRRVFGRRPPSFYCMPGPVWRRSLCRAFHEQFRIPRNLSTMDLIRYAPWEALWMAEFVLALGLPDLVPREPYFLSFPDDGSIRRARARGFRADQLPPHCLGIVVATPHCQLDPLLPGEAARSLAGA